METTVSMVLTLVSLLCNNIMNGSATSPEFRQLSGCTCSGYDIEYMCTAVGVGGFTRYGGTAFNCELLKNVIILLHTDYDKDITKNCSDRISARSLRVTDGHYKSQLLIRNISQELNGRSVICGYGDGTTDSVTVIGTILIRITTDPISQPIVQLLDIEPGKLIFGWNPPIVNCSALHYVISSTGCGNCTNGLMTFSTSVICSIVDIAAATDQRMCRFAVKSVICSNISSPVSDWVDVQLKVPEPPVIVGVVATYVGSTDGLLASTDIHFTEVNPFNITNEVEGSPLYYSVTYTESNTGLQCGSFNISSFSACNHGVCRCSTSLPSSCFHLSGVIIISLSATNRLGRGQSNSFDISTTNVVKLSSDSVICTFSGTPSEELNKSCSITYGPCQQQQLNATISDITNPVQVTLSTELKNGDCYFLNSSNGTFTVLQWGVYYQHSPKVAITITVLAVITAIEFTIIIPGLIIIIIWTYKKWKRKPTSAAAQDLYHIIGPETNNKDLEVYGDVIFIHLQDRPGQLLKVLEAFQKSEIDLVDTKIIGYFDHEHGCGKIFIVNRCKESPSDDKVQLIKQHINREDTLYQNNDTPSDQKMTYSYCKSFPPKCGSLCTFMKEVNQRFGSVINVANINVHPTSENPTYRDITLVFYGVPGYPENWEKEFDEIFVQVCGTN